MHDHLCLHMHKVLLKIFVSRTLVLTLFFSLPFGKPSYNCAVMVHSVLRDCRLSTFIFNLYFQLSAVWDLASKVNLGEFSLLIKEADFPIVQTNSLKSLNILILEFGNMLSKYS